jgi:trehalose 6-phosphate synthase/phosphatase
MTALAHAQGTRNIQLLLDYDGTLVPFARSPELAAPDEEILTLLEALAASPGVTVGIVSGRPREQLDAWFGDQPLVLWAEHAFWHRPHPGAEWQAAAATSPGVPGRIQLMLEQFTTSTPGSHLEVKSASVAWHYRGLQREFGARQAHQLRMLLGDALSNQPFEVLEGEKVIEVRMRGVTKALAAQRLRAGTAPDALVVAIGDDHTDEEMFRALPGSALTVGVGCRPTCARFRVDSYRAVRQMLRVFLRT